MYWFEREREKRTSEVWDKHQSVASRMHPHRDQTQNLGMSWPGIKPSNFCCTGCRSTQLSHTSQGQFHVLFCFFPQQANRTILLDKVREGERRRQQGQQVEIHLTSQRESRPGNPELARKTCNQRLWRGRKKRTHTHSTVASGACKMQAFLGALSTGLGSTLARWHRCLTKTLGSLNFLKGCIEFLAERIWPRILCRRRAKVQPQGSTACPALRVLAETQSEKPS